MAEDRPEGEAAGPAAGATPTAEGGEVGLLGKIIQEGRMARDATQLPYARDLVGEFVTQVLDEGMTVGRDTAAAINARMGISLFL